MSRDERNVRPTREAMMSAAPLDGDDTRTRGARVRPVPSDRLIPREFVTPLLERAVTEASMIDDPLVASDRFVYAAEIAEFGLGDTRSAVENARRATDCASVDARAFSTLRRYARRQQSHDDIRLAYAQEAATGRELQDRLLASLGEFQLWLRAGRPVKELAKAVIDLADDVQHAPADIQAVWRALSEDILVAIGRPDKAAELRSLRWTSLRQTEGVSSEEIASVALSAAALAEHGRLKPDEILSWYDVAFKAEPSVVAARPLLRWAWASGDFGMIETVLRTLADVTDDADIRSSSLYQLGMLGARVTGDARQGMADLRESLQRGRSAGIGAAAFLSLARSSHGKAVPDEVVLALTARVQFAASGMERADLFTQMAEHFDLDLQLPDAAIDMAKDALAECPSWTPAMRLLGTIYARQQKWDALTALHNQQLSFESDPDERRRLHERIAEVAHEKLHDIPSALAHLKDALEYGWRQPSSRRLATIFRELMRWEELYEHQITAAERAPIRGEKLRLLEEAASVAEERLHDLPRTVAAWQAALHVDPAHSTALSALERIFTQNNRWEDLLVLCEHELRLTDASDVHGVLALLCRCADVAQHRLADARRAEEYYARALELDPLYDDALRGLGVLFNEQGRWDELVEMTERELESAGTPERRARCLRQIGELYVHKLNDRDRAIRTYKRLGNLGRDWHEEALLWLERLYEANDDAALRVGVLKGRRELSEDIVCHAKLSFRIAEILEWEEKRPDRALGEYLAAMDDPSIQAEVLYAIERCLAMSALSDDARADVLQTVQDKLDESNPVACRAGFELLLDDARRRADRDDEQRLLDALSLAWGDDRHIAEATALRQLAAGQWDAAEQIRDEAGHGTVDTLRSMWRQLDLHHVVHLEPLQDLVPTYMAQWLAREHGELGGFVGADDRDLLYAIQSTSVSLGELLSPSDTWISKHLAVRSARVLNDVETLERLLQDLAQEAEDPVLAMELWLNAANEPLVSPATRGRWLRAAAAQGNFRHPMRQGVYQAMQSTSDIDGLVDALSRHMDSGEAEGDELAQLALWKGRALDGVERRNEAVQALRVAMIHAPSNPTIATEKARIEVLAGDLSAARATLEDVLNSGCPDDARFDILSRLAELHLKDGGVRERAISALEEAYRRSNFDRESALRLANVQLSHGSAERSAELLQAVLREPVTEDDVRYWQLLGSTLAHRLERVEEGEATLWKVFDAFPERPEALTALDDIVRRRDRALPFAEALRARLEDPNHRMSKARRAALWLTLGDLLHQSLHRFEEAELAYDAAMQQGARASDALLRRAAAAAKQEGRHSHAASTYVEAVDAPDFDTQQLGVVCTELDTLYAQAQESSRLRAVRQLRSSLGHQVMDVAAVDRRLFDQPVDSHKVWANLGSDMLTERERLVLEDTAPLAVKIFAKRQELRGAKYSSEKFRFFNEALDAICHNLGVAVPRLQVSGSSLSAATVDGQNFVVPESRIANGEPHAARFWAGWVAGIAYSGLGVYSSLDDSDIRELLMAVAARAGDDVPAGDRGLYDETGGLMLMSVRRNAETAHRRAPEVALSSGQGRASKVRAIGDRIGMVACDHPGVALREIIAAGSGATPSAFVDLKQVRDVPRIRNVVRFALSDDYLRLRETLGVGPQGNTLRGH